MKVEHSSSSSKNDKQSCSWLIYLLVATVAVACYVNGIGGDFVHDDIPAVTLNKDVLALNPLWNTFENDFWGTPMADEDSHKSYRPLTTLTFRANYLYFGLQPVWFHVTNVLLHAFACILFTRLCLCVANLRSPFATLAGILFAVHPVHTEAVTGIVGRADVLASIFFLLSLLAYHGCPSGNNHVWLSALLGGLSMLAKETGITVFLLNASYDFYLHWGSIKRAIVEAKWNQETMQFAKRVVKVLASAGVLLSLRLAILQGSLPKFGEQDNPAAFHPSFCVRLLSFSYLAAFNFWLLLCPATLSHDWQMGSIPLVTSVSDTRNLLTAFFGGLTFLLAIRCTMDFENQRKAPVVLGLMLLLAPFIPASNLVLTVGFVVAERVLYLPSLGCILLVAYGIQEMWHLHQRQRQTIAACVILLVVTGCFRTIVRNKDWQSRESLLRSGLISLPHNAKMHYNYANFLRDSSRTELAKSHYRTALRLWPTYASAHNNLGTILSDQKLAERHFLAAIRFSVKHINAHYNLGKLYRKANKSSESERMLQKCITLDSTFSPAYLELAKLWGANNKSVIGLLKKVVELNPKNPYYASLFGRWLIGRGNHKEALKYYWISLQIMSSYQKAVSGVLKILRRFGQKARMFQVFTRWHLVIGTKRGRVLLNSSNVYLQGWHLKTELRHKADIYSKSKVLHSSPICGKNCNTSLNTETNKWRTSTQNQSEAQSQSSPMPLMMGLLDSV